MPDYAIRILELRSVRGTGGGPEKTILLGTARTDPSRYAVTVCYIRDTRDDIFHIDSRASELPIDYVEILERHSFDPRIWPKLRALVRARRIDIVHAHDYKTDLLALLLARVEPVIPLATAHGWAGHGIKERLLYYPADRKLLARFPRVIVVSGDLRDAVLRAGGKADRLVVVPNGIDDEEFRRSQDIVERARSAFGVTAHDVAIGAVGRLEREKNYNILLTAFASLSREYTQTRLLIAGEGSQRRSLERRIAALGLLDRCRVLGHVSDVKLLHHALDIFVMCSDNEASPNALLEAMALGTPIVATRVGGVVDLIRHGEHGLLIPRRDPAALVAALREVLAHPASARTRAEAARRRVEAELSFDKRMQRVERIYDELLDEHPEVRRGRRLRR